MIFKIPIFIVIFVTALQGSFAQGTTHECFGYYNSKKFLKSEELDRLQRRFQALHTIELMDGPNIRPQDVRQANKELYQAIRTRFSETPLQSKHQLMPVALEFPIKEILTASTDDMPSLLARSVFSAIDKELKSYRHLRNQPELFTSGKSLDVLKKEGTLEDLYIFLHDETTELWSPAIFPSRFGFIFHNLNDLISALITTNKKTQTIDVSKLSKVLAFTLDLQGNKMFGINYDIPIPENVNIDKWIFNTGILLPYSIIEKMRSTFAGSDIRLVELFISTASQQAAIIIRRPQVIGK